MIRRLLIVCAFVLPGGPLFSQLLPGTSQAFQLAPAFNPAFTGIEEFTSFKLGYRNQWAGFPGAPRYVNMAVHGRIQRPANVTHNALKAGKTVTIDEIPKSKRIIQGLGGTFVYESNGANGLIETLEGGITYSIHYPISNKMYVAVGASANYGSTRIRWDKINIDDPLIEAGKGNSISNINVRTGLLIYSPKFYLHAAYLQAYSKTKNEILSNDIGYRYKMSGGIGTRFNVSPTTELRPSVAALMDEFDNIDIDYSLKVYLGEKAWGGLTYRDNGFAAIILGFEFNPLIGASYSYEIATGGLKGFNGGSNEIIVGLKLANLRKLNPYLW